MSVTIVIDSAADIPRQEAENLGLVHVPLTVLFGEEAYLDTVDLSHREFYEKLIETDVHPTTSMISPADFEAAFRKAVENGNSVLAFTVSGKLSGTYQSACIAAAEFPGKVFVVDSENVSLGERILILRAMELRRQGLSAEEMAEILNEEKKKIRVLALLDTLEYLKRGGRISKTVALAGGLLSIKPVIAIENGEIAIKGKARGSKQGNNLLRELVDECGGINFGKPYCLAYSGLSDALLQKYIADSTSLWQGDTDTLPIATVGCVIGAHAGPGAVAVAFFET